VNVLAAAMEVTNLGIAISFDSVFPYSYQAFMSHSAVEMATCGQVFHFSPPG
jgi:hypothetical protein